MFNPDGLQRVISEVIGYYPAVPLYVTSIGSATVTDDVSDKPRVEWMRYHMNELLKCKYYHPRQPIRAIHVSLKLLSVLSNIHLIQKSILL